MYNYARAWRWVLPLCGFMAFAPGFAAETSIYEQAKITEVWQPVPVITAPGEGQPPSDAMVLLGDTQGTASSRWESVNGGPAPWPITDGVMTVVPRTGDIRTKRAFGNVQLHLEWRTPSEVRGDGQGRGNSGVFLMDRYEVQVLDSVDNPTYANGQAASIYKQHIPLANASKGPGEWQSYDILFTAPMFGAAGRVVRPATITVLHNGVLVQHNVTIEGPMTFVGKPNYEPHEAAPIRLQDHGNPVSFRNIWVREL